jgi:hypothetical protein
MKYYGVTHGSQFVPGSQFLERNPMRGEVSGEKPPIRTELENGVMYGLITTRLEPQDWVDSNLET